MTDRDSTESLPDPSPVAEAEPAVAASPKPLRGRKRVPPPGALPECYALSMKEKRERAFAWKVEGKTVHQIAQLLGVTPQTASAILKSEHAFREQYCAQEARHLIAEDVARLEAMFEHLFRQATSSTNKYSSRAAEVALKVLERKARLLGLDAPVKQDISVEWHGLSDADLQEELRRLHVSLLDMKIPESLPGELPAPRGEIIEGHLEPAGDPSAQAADADTPGPDSGLAGPPEASRTSDSGQ